MAKTKLLYALEAAQGGALRHLLYLISAFASENFEITVVLSNDREENLDECVRLMKQKGCDVLLLPMKRSIHLVADLVVFLKILKLIKERRFDVVHAHSSKAGVLFRFAAWLCNVSLILYTPHCFYFQAHSGIKRWVFVWIERVMALLTDRIIVSKNEQLAALNAGVCGVHKLSNINNAIKFDESISSQSVSNIKFKYGISTSLVVGSVGRLTVQKDWPTFIYAARDVVQRISDVTFVIAGDGEERKNLEIMIASLGLEEQVKLLGYVGEVGEVYRILDVYVNSSLWEGLPYSYLEAMHHRKPVVATCQGDMDMLEDGETGYIIPKSDSALLGARLIDLLSQKEKIQSFGEQSKLRILQYRYSFDRFVAKHRALYKHRCR